MSCGLAELLERLQAHKLKDESLLVPENAFMTAQRGVAAAFELSWEELSASSQLVGEWISLFAESGINEDLILALFMEKSPQILLKNGAIERYFPTFSKWFGLSKEVSKPINQTDLLIPTKADLRHLVNLSLLTDVGNNNYELHTLIRYYLREKLEASPLKEEVKRAYGRVMVSIAQTIKQTLTLEDIANLEPYIEHLKVAAEEFHQWLEGEDLTWPFYGLSTFYRAQGLYQQAVPYFERCLTLSEERFGPKHPQVATSLNNLAALYESQGKYAEAEPLYRRSLAIWEKQLGENHPQVATSLNNLAGLYRVQGKYAEAEPLYQRAIAILLATLGENHPNTQTVIMNYYFMLSQLPDDELNQRFPPEVVEMLHNLR
jgi:tetratricopeptide (TPR) repeat protein